MAGLRLFGHDISVIDFFETSLTRNYGSWILTACSSDLDGMHYLNEIISKRVGLDGPGHVRFRRPVLWFSIGNFNKDMDNNKHNNTLESEKQTDLGFWFSRSEHVGFRYFYFNDQMTRQAGL
ncbi:unnamed protein product [Rhizophagus irregularis]|nr:unnamed protein product [Rhizophagus irregularis]